MSDDFKTDGGRGMLREMPATSQVNGSIWLPKLTCALTFSEYLELYCQQLAISGLLPATVRSLPREFVVLTYKGKQCSNVNGSFLPWMHGSAIRGHGRQSGQESPHQQTFRSWLPAAAEGFIQCDDRKQFVPLRLG